MCNVYVCVYMYIYVYRQNVIVIKQITDTVAVSDTGKFCKAQIQLQQNLIITSVNVESFYI